MDRFTKFFYIYTTGFSKNLDALGQLLRRKIPVFHRFFSLNIVNNTVCFLIVCPQWTDASDFSFITSPPLLQKQSAHGYKSIETKRLHQRNAENDPPVEKTGSERSYHHQVTGSLPGNACLHELSRHLSALQFL